MKLYKTFVRSKLEYATSVWNPYLLKDVKIIESVQRAFTLRLPQMGALQGQYSERLRILNLETLEGRRLVIDLKLMYKIIYGLIDLKFEDFFEWSKHGGTRNRLYKPGLKKNLNCRKNFFTVRMIDLWNSLPNEIVNAPSLAKFTELLKGVNFRPHLQFS